MTNFSSRIYRITGQGGKEMHALACGVTVMARLLFEEKRSSYDIRVTKHIYPEVAQALDGKATNVSRSISRVLQKCWASKEGWIREEVIGNPHEDMHAPRDMLVYLAAYAQFGMPYYKAVEQFPEKFV